MHRDASVVGKETKTEDKKKGQKGLTNLIPPFSALKGFLETNGVSNSGMVIS